MSVVLTRALRGGMVESVHHGSIAVVDSLGRLLAMAGDPASRVCLRSGAKPFQAMPLLEYGGIGEFDLSGEEIALTCGSHGGESIHVATAAALLRKGEFDEEDLRCGAHPPLDEKAAADLRASGEEPSPLHNNCSGKHAGMLLATQVMDVPSSGYADETHPLQELVRATLADFGGIPADEIPLAVDGCSAPTFYLSLYRAALAYARLLATAEGPQAPGSIDRYGESAATIVEAMTSFPEYVAGNWSMTTPLMASYAGGLLAKEGAEGFYAMGVTPSLAAEISNRLGLEKGCAIGIALKIDDGSMRRGRNQAILRLLEQLGLEPEVRPDLAPWASLEIRNHAGLLVGELRADFELEEP